MPMPMLTWACATGSIAAGTTKPAARMIHRSVFSECILFLLGPVGATPGASFTIGNTRKGRLLL